MLDQSQNRMWARYFAFLAVSMLIIVINLYLGSLWAPNPPGGPPANVSQPEDMHSGETEGKKESVSAEKTTGSSEKPSASAIQQEKETVKAQKSHLPEPPVRYVTLGSLDPESPYRMLVTLSSRGAAVSRLELNSPKYCDTEARGGYLGELFFEPPLDKGPLQVDVVGPGTPAALAGLRAGDVLLSIDDKPVEGILGFRQIMDKTRPGQTVSLTIRRGDKQLTLEARLRRTPMAIIRREEGGPYSFEMTLAALGKERLVDVRSRFEERMQETNDPLQKEVLYLQWLHSELPDIHLKSENWYLLPDGADPTKPETWIAACDDEGLVPRESVRFAQWLPDKNLVIVKRYELARVSPGKRDDHDDPSYHFTLGITVINVGQSATSVAYEVDGPNGLPTEGAWYARKMSNSWSAVGLRDVAVRVGNNGIKLVACPAIARDRWGAPWKDTEKQLITALGVDAQYFSVILLPQREQPSDIWFADARPIRIGAVEPNYEYLTNVSCRLQSVPVELKPGDRLSHTFKVFAGPKRSDLLAHYELGGLIQYGWFWFVADPMTRLLHIFHDYLVFNYGLAIILLTVVVRLLMFPISRKQALNAQKMQELQPEIKKIQEKYKDLQERNRATQELFRQHNYNPFSGCLVLFIQLPIFIGLYKALAIDVELRQAPLISESIRWCSNLAAPDMLFDWSFLWPEWFNRGHGMFGLGPYFNILPVLTIALFLWQQKRMMPPPADEQAAVQQKVMNFMMIFMGILFYKVPSGLCLYFIASSLWGMAEREILLKTVKKPDKTRKAKRDWKNTWQKIQSAIPDWLKALVKAADKRYAEKMPRERQRPPAKRTRV